MKYAAIVLASLTRADVNAVIMLLDPAPKAFKPYIPPPNAAVEVLSLYDSMVLVVPGFRNTLRDGMQIHWYNAVMAEENGPAEERRPLRTRIMRWIAGRVD